MKPPTIEFVSAKPVLGTILTPEACKTIGTIQAGSDILGDYCEVTPDNFFTTVVSAVGAGTGGRVIEGSREDVQAAYAEAVTALIESLPPVLPNQAETTLGVLFAAFEDSRRFSADRATDPHAWIDDDGQCH